MVLNRGFGIFFLAFLVVGFSGLAAADASLGIFQTTSLGIGNVPSPSILSVSENGSSVPVAAFIPSADRKPAPFPDDVPSKDLHRSSPSVQDLPRADQDQWAQLRKLRQDALDHARGLEENLTAKIKTLRTQGALNESQKAELNAQINLQLMAAYDRRIQLAKRLEAEGANAALVSDFVSFAKANWNQYANATASSDKKDLVVQFNQHWAQFRQAVVKDVLIVKLQSSVNVSRRTLARLDAVVAKLSTAGFDTSGLSNESAAISVQLDSVLSSRDLPMAVFRLHQIRDGLSRMRGDLQHIVNHEPMDSYREIPMPSASIDASLAIPGRSLSHTAAGVTAAPSTPPTNGDGSASASGSLTINASAGSGST